MVSPLRLAAALVLAATCVAIPAHAAPAAHVTYGPGHLPYPGRPVGTHDPSTPIQHIVIVMQENHSFDEYFGMLPRSGQPKADGFTFDAHGRPINSNPVGKGRQTVFHRLSYCPGDSAGQGWTSTHKEIDRGRMDGFANLSRNSMSYYTQADLPFYYSLATQYTLANRWFASAPAQTYPNRRFLYAGTAYGNISTDTGSLLDPPPARGTIQDELSAHNISWADYMTDAPDTGIVGSNVKTHPQNMRQMANFYLDAKLGQLPAVSYVDSGLGAAGEALGPLDPVTGQAPKPVKDDVVRLKATGSNEEGDDVRIGESFVSRVTRAVTSGPDWGSTLMIWLYDEHGGFYDHVPSPRALAPDAIKPKLSKTDYPGGYDQLGIRVPAVVISPWAKPHAVTNVLHDHTSVLAEIERTWNLPALTYRDANAADLRDFLDLRRPALAKPPTLAAPGAVGLMSCTSDY
ncbi:MAG: phospholipase [Frankiales bacterium]|jgi:phospholipase C|nr:phospholipase [Frankiales bacterium]